MLYIVYISIDNAVNDDWFRWMRAVHVPDVMQTGCFSDATIVRDLDADTEERTAYRIIYRAHSDGAFDRYQDEFANVLQADHTARYEGRFEARRELLPIVKRVEEDAPSDETA